MLMLCTSVLVTVLDQITKTLVRGHIPLNERRPVIPGTFDLSYVQNTDAAYGMLQGLSHWLVVLSIVMLIGLVVFRRYFIRDARIYRLAVGLMVGGIVGNLIDRVKWGYVIDFLHFYWRTHSFPDFNVADSAICVGVGLYILAQMREKPQPSVPAK
jgi:signal peptidase II